MKRKLIPIAGLAGLALSGWSAHASSVFNYTDGDLILDFSESGYSDVEVDIGSLANLDIAAAANDGSVNLNGLDYNLTTQLLNNFGGNVDGVSFSVLGLQNLASGSIAAETVWLTQQQSGDSPNSAPYDLASQNQNTVKGDIQHIVGLGNSTGITEWSAENAANSVNNTANVAIIPTGGAARLNSYSYIVGSSLNGASTIGLGAPKNTIGDSSIISDLYEFDNVGSGSQSIYAGQFTFNTDGSLVFDPVPEPKTYALLAVGGVLFLSLRKHVRNKIA